jgi:hypothetical protein
MIRLQCGHKITRMVAMLVRAIFISLGCLTVWLVVLPTMVILGGAALFLYATLAEITGLLTGSEPRTLDASAIRLTARRICGGAFVRH